MLFNRHIDEKHINSLIPLELATDDYRLSYVFKHVDKYYYFFVLIEKIGIQPSRTLRAFIHNIVANIGSLEIRRNL